VVLATNGGAEPPPHIGRRSRYTVVYLARADIFGRFCCGPGLAVLSLSKLLATAIRIEYRSGKAMHSFLFSLVRKHEPGLWLIVSDMDNSNRRRE
jgi:hypothetical protein